MKRVSNQSRAFVRGLFCISIMLLGLSILSTMNIKSDISSNDSKVSFSLIPHAPISITSDSGLEVFPGNGTEEDPYVIEGYNITTTDDNGIYITGTTKHFVIRYCYTDASEFGIYIDGVTYGTTSIMTIHVKTTIVKASSF